jgi:hypothetical protein
MLIMIFILSTTVGIQDGSFDAFLWETFTTKPSFDKGEVKKVKSIPENITSSSHTFIL